MTVSEGTDYLVTQADLSSISPQKVKIAEVILAADSPTIQFSGLNQGYRDLEIVAEVRSSATGTSDGLRFRVNNNATATTHEFQEINASGSVVAASRGTAAFLLMGEMMTSQAPAGRFSLHRSMLGNYSDTGKWTPYTSQASTGIAGVGPWLFQHSGFYNVNEAVTALLFNSSTGANFIAGSRITIYGVNPINPTGVVPVDLATVRALRPYKPDGLDLSYGVGNGSLNGAPGLNSIAINALRGFMSDVRVTLPQTTIAYPARPVSGTRLDSVVLRIDNANGGPSNSQLAIKTGSVSAYPAMTTGDIYSDSSAVYEIELHRIVMPTTGAPTTFFDVRPISQGVDGQSGSLVKLDDITLSVDAASVIFQNIPQTFKTLSLISNPRCANGANTTFAARLNQSAAVAYDNQVLQGQNVTASAGRSTDQTFAFLGDATAYHADGRIWHSLHETTIGVYSKQGFFKTLTTRISQGQDNSPMTQQTTSIWLNEAAITSLQLYITAGNLRAESTFALYGLR